MIEQALTSKLQSQNTRYQRRFNH